MEVSGSVQEKSSFSVFKDMYRHWNLQVQIDKACNKNFITSLNVFFSLVLMFYEHVTCYENKIAQNLKMNW